MNIPSVEEIIRHPELKNYPEFNSGSHEAVCKTSKDPDFRQDEVNVRQDDVNANNSIFDFLKFCHSQNEMELYYLLLNEIEIKNFKKPIIEIASISKIAHEKTLKEMLSKWSGEEWNIAYSKQDKIITLKQQLLEKVKVSEDFAIIKNYFPNADISDIILKS